MVSIFTNAIPRTRYTQRNTLQPKQLRTSSDHNEPNYVIPICCGSGRVRVVGWGSRSTRSVWFEHWVKPLCVTRHLGYAMNCVKAHCILRLDGHQAHGSTHKHSYPSAAARPTSLRSLAGEIIKANQAPMTSRVALCLVACFCGGNATRQSCLIHPRSALVGRISVHRAPRPQTRNVCARHDWNL
jgi:hypothetical protein